MPAASAGCPSWLIQSASRQQNSLLPEPQRRQLQPSAFMLAAARSDLHVNSQSGIFGKWVMDLCRMGGESAELTCKGHPACCECCCQLNDRLVPLHPNCSSAWLCVAVKWTQQSTCASPAAKSCLLCTVLAQSTLQPPERLVSAGWTITEVDVRISTLPSTHLSMSQQHLHCRLCWLAGHIP